MAGLQLGLRLGLGLTPSQGGGSGSPTPPTGNAVVGQTLTAPSADSYQWLRQGGLVIPGATSQTYTLQNLDVGIKIAREQTTAGAKTTTGYTAAIAGLGAASDTFVRSDQALSASPDWQIGGTNAALLQVVGNQLQLQDTSTTGTGAAFRSLGSLDHFIEATLIATFGTGFICVRYVDFNNWIGARYVPGTGIQLFTRVSGTLVTQIGATFAVTSATGDKLRIEASAATVTVKLNGTAVIGPIATTLHPNADRVGVCSRSSVGRISAISGGTLGTIRAAETSAIMIACEGDSLTDGQGSTTGAQTATRPAVSGNKDYPSQLLDLMSGRVTWNGGFAGQTSTQIMARVRDESARYGRTMVFWAGRNDYTPAATVLANIATMVGIANTYCEGRFLVLTVLNGTTASLSADVQTQHDAVISLDNSIIAAYPNNVIDIRSQLVALAAPGAAYPDSARYALDQEPAVLTVSDGIHQLDAGYAIVAKRVFDELVARRWALPVAA